MYRRIICLLMIVCVVCADHDVECCHENEVLQEQGIDCATCDNYQIVKCAVIHERRCYCKPGYVRNCNWECVPTEKCPFERHCKCSANETFQESGYDCKTCDQIEIEVKCALEKVPKCYCNPGYVRNASHHCVLKKDCDYSDCRDAVKCGPNEVPSCCATPCPPTCQNPHEKCEFLVCNKGCVCRDGYIRLTTQGECVRRESCPKNCTEPHQEYLECGSYCPPTCQDGENPVICPAVCVTGCFCRPPYILNKENGKCVLKEDC